MPCTIAVAVALQIPEEPFTVKDWNPAGAVNERSGEIVPLFQVYVAAPSAVNVTEVPIQTVAAANATLIFGNG